MPNDYDDLYNISWCPKFNSLIVLKYYFIISWNNILFLSKICYYVYVRIWGVSMDSRETKFKDSDLNNGMSRSNRNSKLYRQVYGKYQNLDNLPLEDNTDEIDIDSLKELLIRSENKTRNTHEDINIDILEPKKRSIDNERVHDINKLLEKARYENKKIREPDSNNKIISNSRSILETLGTGDYEGNYLKKEPEEVKEKIEASKPVNLEMTRELKNLTRNIAENTLAEQTEKDSDLSLDLLSDLKPTENTIVTEPIKDTDTKENDEEVKKEIKEEKKEENSFKKVKLESVGKKEPKIKKINTDDEPFFPMNTSDTTDIDIIKEPVQIKKDVKNVDNDFFTSSYEFSRKDFVDYDDDENSKSNNILKIILLVLAIFVFSGVIAYFILNYGINK